MSAWLASMLQKTQGYKGRQLTAAELELLEEDLHIRCLEPAGNKLMMQILRQHQSPFIITRIFYDLLAIPVETATLEEHALVYDMLPKGNWALAAACLKDHLERAQSRTLQRLKCFPCCLSPTYPTLWKRTSRGRSVRQGQPVVRHLQTPLHRCSVDIHRHAGAALQGLLGLRRTHSPAPE
ncbi:hypothetical protein LNO81_19045 [Klebsiella variicola subsp. variicola]|nr:hypothetical protein [Klebsiella variicola subsp. variicola]